MLHLPSTLTKTIAKADSRRFLLHLHLKKIPYDDSAMKHFDKMVKDLKEGKGVSFPIDLTVDSDTGTAVFD